MRKFAVVLSLAGLGMLMLFAVPQLGSGQMGVFVQDQSMEAERDLELEIQILKIINRMELTEEQMTLLRDNIAEIRTSYDSVTQTQVELREFLMDFNGTRSELNESIAPIEERVYEAEKVFGEQLFSTLDQFKDVFTMRQGEILQGHDWDWDGHNMDGFEFNFDGDLHLDERFFDKLEDKIHVFENRMEDWGERVGEWGEELGERLEELFEDLEDGDYHHYRVHSENNNWRVLTDKDVKVYGMPQMHMRIDPHHLMGHGMMSEFLTDNLEVWERLLTEKLERMSPVTPSEDSI